MPYVRRQGIPCEVLDGELTILDSAREKFVSTNEVGAFIWEKLEQPSTLAELCDSVMESCSGAERAVVEVDTSEFLEAMLEKGLIEEVDKPVLT